MKLIVYIILIFSVGCLKQSEPVVSEKILYIYPTLDSVYDVELQNEILIIALRWAKLRLKQKSGTVDSSLIIEKIENIQRTMKKFSNIKTKCTSIKGTADEISEYLDELRDTIKADLSEVSKSLK